VRLDSRASLNKLIPLARRVDVIEAVIRWWQDLDRLGANHGACGKVASPPTIGFDQAEDDADTR
jgi:hypothetical protein